MKYLYPLAILFIVLPFLSKAQSNYKPGYVITTKGDTIRGLIDYQDWEGNPQVFRFKTAATNDVQRFTIANVNYVEINQFGAYQKYKINISTDIIDIQHLESLRDTSFRTDVVFLKVLQAGKNVTLYSFTDNLKTRYYVKETTSNKTPYELTYKVYQRDSKTSNDNTYIKQLFDLSAEFKNNDETLANNIERAEYRKDDILKVISEINNISATEYQLKYKDKTRVSFFAGAGVSLASFQLTSIQASGKLSNNSTMPMLTAGIDIIANPTTSRLFFRVEAALTENKFKEAFPNAISPYYPLNYSFSLIGINLIPQLVYNVYNAENFKLYLSPGVQVAFVSEKDAHFNQINGSTVTPIYPLLIFNSVTATAAIKAGAKINKRYDFSGSYQLPTTLTKAQNAKIDIKSIFIGLNYYFGK